MSRTLLTGLGVCRVHALAGFRMSSSAKRKMGAQVNPASRRRWGTSCAASPQSRDQQQRARGTDHQGVAKAHCGLAELEDRVTFSDAEVDYWKELLPPRKRRLRLGPVVSSSCSSAS